MSPRKIDFYFKSSETLDAIAREARRLAELQQLLVKIAPPQLAQACHVTRLNGGTLVLLSDNAAIAAKLKQIAPRLLTELKKQRSEVTSIQFVVQVEQQASSRRSKADLKTISLDSIEHLDRLAATLADSPLKLALTNLAQHQRSDKEKP